MSEAAVLTASQPATTPTSSSPLVEPQPPISPAVARCVDAYNRTYKTERAARRDEIPAIRSAQRAFRAALPPLVGHENIRDFIACIAQSILLGAIDTNDASKLLYAAQVALAAGRIQSALAKPLLA
jgi:hypothetical protein